MAYLLYLLAILVLLVLVLVRHGVSGRAAALSRFSVLVCRTVEYRGVRIVITMNSIILLKAVRKSVDAVMKITLKMTIEGWWRSLPRLREEEKADQEPIKVNGFKV
ncbi:hypothetical protein B0J18DRAFT_418071 [Chaetomium sp. MPI-SDFR-AT-0129]|nr:hypothetical protein B0J18DRAFT_418071 [Chaetomium sp. MPI-SDFR-AT-0129]